MFMEDGLLHRKQIYPFMFDNPEDCAKEYRNLPQEKYADDFARNVIFKNKYRYFLK